MPFISNLTKHLICCPIVSTHGQIKTFKFVGANTFIGEEDLLEIKRNPVFDRYLESNNLVILAKEPEVKGQKNGEDIYETPEGEPSISLQSDEVGKKHKYIPSKELLTGLSGIGASTADKIIAEAKKADWYSYSEMVTAISDKYKGVDWQKSTDSTIS